MRTILFDFHVYSGTDDGDISEKAIEIKTDFEDKAAAKKHAGKLCKKYNGPVDLAYSGFKDWNERYLTTAMPSKFHSAGYRLEKLA